MIRSPWNFAQAQISVLLLHVQTFKVIKLVLQKIYPSDYHDLEKVILSKTNPWLREGKEENNIIDFGWLSLLCFLRSLAQYIFWLLAIHAINTSDAPTKQFNP